MVQTLTQQKIFGQKYRKRPRRPLSEYGKMLREKQALKELYGLREKQFKRYVKEALAKRGKVDVAEYLIQRLEKRLDNVVYRLGFAKTRKQARQFVSHGHFLVSGRKVRIPSFQVSKGDTIEIRPGSKDKGPFKDLREVLKEHHPPSWLKLDLENLKGEVIGEPSLAEANIPLQLSLVFEFYAR